MCFRCWILLLRKMFLVIESFGISVSFWWMIVIFVCLLVMMFLKCCFLLYSRIFLLYVL